MLTETGRVVACGADVLWVETIRQSTCGSCSANKACGHSLINSISDGKRSLIRVLPGQHAVNDCSVNDSVRISIPEEVILRGSFIAYMLPLLCMLAGAVLAVQLAGAQSLLLGSDASAGIGAVLGLLFGFLLVRWHATSHKNDASYQPVLLEILHEQNLLHHNT
ncbi:MAG: SoxR reducing system RseC family protein [Halioglobus sp.]